MLRSNSCNNNNCIINIKEEDYTINNIYDKDNIKLVKLFQSSPICQVFKVKINDKYYCIKKYKNRFQLKALNEININERLKIRNLFDNIIKYYTYYIEGDKNNYTLNLVFELSEIGSLKDYLNSKVTLEINEIRQIITDISKGIITCHLNNIIHNDIKLENILMVSVNNANNNSLRAKLCDFNISLILNENTTSKLDNTNQGMAGINYKYNKTLSPNNKNTFLFDQEQEACLNSYNYSLSSNNLFNFDYLFENPSKAFDYFLLGILVYRLTFKVFPFTFNNTYSLIQEIKAQNYKDHLSYKESKNTLLKDLIDKLLNFYPKNRLNDNTILEHIFLKDCLYKMIKIKRKNKFKVKYYLLKHQMINKVKKCKKRSKIFKNSKQFLNDKMINRNIDINNNNSQELRITNIKRNFFMKSINDKINSNKMKKRLVKSKIKFIN